MMGIYFKNYSKQNFMLGVFHGAVSDADLDTHISRLLEPEYDQVGKLGLAILCENIITSEMSFHGIFSAGKRMKGAGFRANGKLAIVAKSTVSFGLAKTYQLATEVLNLDETRVMRGHQLPLAMQWLNIEPDISNDIELLINKLEST